MISDYVESIGIELEGGLDYNEIDNIKEYVKSYKVESRYRQHYDPSVHVRNKQESQIELTYWHADADAFFDFVQYAFDCGLKQDRSCGNHVHIRFKDLDKALSVFSFKPAWDEFMKKYEEFAETREDKDKYLSRLANGYCKAKRHESSILNQLNTKHGKAGRRYTAINLNAYHLYGTIEFRLIPHFENFNEAEETITWLIETVDAIMKKYETVAVKLASKRFRLSTEQVDCQTEVENSIRQDEIEVNKPEFLVDETVIVKEKVNGIKMVKPVKKEGFTKKDVKVTSYFDEVYEKLMESDYDV